MGEFDDADLDGLLAGIDTENELANPQVGGGPPAAKPKKSRAKDSKPKREPPRMIRAPDGSSFGMCRDCGKRCAAAMLPQYGGYGHECEEVDPTIKLKELAAKEKAKKGAAKDRFEAAKMAAKRELAEREPCKPKSAYQHFCASRRVEIKEERPDLDPKVLTSLLADDWAAVTPDRRVRWEAMAAADKEIFDERMAACEGEEEGANEEGEKAPKPEPKAKAPKQAAPKGEPAEPKPRYKKAKTAWVLYCEKNRARIVENEPGLKMPEVLQALAAEWRELDSEGKVPYAEAHEAEKARLAQSPELAPPPKAKRAPAAAGAKRKREGKGAGKACAAEGDDAAEGGGAEEHESVSECDADEGDGAASAAEDEEAEAGGVDGADEAAAAAEAAPEPRKPKARKARVVESDDED